jgi:multimeric flavodoxin WrbA
MNVLLVNGSPNQEGCTFTALSEVAKALNEEGIDTSFFQLGVKPVYGCTACGKCGETKRCVFESDRVNVLIEAMAKADGIVIGSPVYYAGANGALCALLDRAFFFKSELYAFKPAAAVVSCRRGGAGSAFDRLNKYFSISRMPIVSGRYWNAVHGTKPEEVLKDREGLQQMRTIGKNMAWLIKSIKKAALPTPAIEPWERMDFHHEGGSYCDQ